MREALDALIQLAAYRHSTPAIRKPTSTKSLYYPTRDEVAGGGRGFEPSVPPRLKQVRDRGMIAPQRRLVVAHRAAGDTAVVAAFEVRRQGHCANSRLLSRTGSPSPNPLPFQNPSRPRPRSRPRRARGRPARSGCAAGRPRAARRRRVDAGVLDRVPLALERDMRLGPQRVHDLDLLL